MKNVRDLFALIWSHFSAADESPSGWCKMMFMLIYRRRYFRRFSFCEFNINRIRALDMCLFSEVQRLSSKYLLTLQLSTRVMIKRVSCRRFAKRRSSAIWPILSSRWQLISVTHFSLNLQWTQKSLWSAKISIKLQTFTQKNEKFIAE